MRVRSDKRISYRLHRLNSFFSESVQNCRFRQLMSMMNEMWRGRPINWFGFKDWSLTRRFWHCTEFRKISKKNRIINLPFGLSLFSIPSLVGTISWYEQTAGNTFTGLICDVWHLFLLVTTWDSASMSGMNYGEPKKIVVIIHLSLSVLNNIDVYGKSSSTNSQNVSIAYRSRDHWRVLFSNTIISQF